MGKRDTRIAWVNPVAQARSSGPPPSSKPSIRDYLNRPRPTWEEFKEMKARTQGSETLAAWEEKLNQKFRDDLQKQRDKALSSKMRKDPANKKKKSKKIKRKRLPSTSSSSVSSDSEDSEDDRRKKKARKKRKHKDRMEAKKELASSSTDSKSSHSVSKEHKKHKKERHHKKRKRKKAKK